MRSSTVRSPIHADMARARIGSRSALSRKTIQRRSMTGWRRWPPAVRASPLGKTGSGLINETLFISAGSFQVLPSPNNQGGTAASDPFVPNIRDRDKFVEFVGSCGPSLMLASNQFSLLSGGDTKDLHFNLATSSSSQPLTREPDRRKASPTTRR